MSNNIDKLPIELLYRILDNLDVKTIVFSFRSVCRLFRSVVNTYNQFDLNLTIISKLNFYVLCRLIHPTNIISLTLSNDERTSDQIDSFISIVHLRQFNRLRSLTLLNIDQLQLNFILKRINLNFLTSFSFTIRKYDNNQQETTDNLLTSIIIQSNFRKLEFNIDNYILSKISWPINFTIQYLTINGFINIDKIFTILQFCRHLHTFIVKITFENMFINIIHISFEQLKSLSIEEFDGTMNQLESFLLMTPSLVYFKVINGEQMLDGQRWEQFIETNLHQLKNFEFFFEEQYINEISSEELALILSSFQTSFWIENKKWFIICEYEIPYSNIVSLYSIPLCKSYMHYETKSDKVLLSTNTTMMNNESLVMNNISSIHIGVNKELVDHIEKKKATTNHPLFPKITKIDIQFGWPGFSFQLFSVFIDISRITQFKLSTDCFSEYNENIFTDIGIFIRQAHNISSLILSSGYVTQHIMIPAAIYFIVPSYIKHLQIPVNYLYQVKTIVERCQDLCTVQFDTTHSTLLEDIVKWFADNTINSTCRKHIRSVNIWMGKKRIQSTETKNNHKRIKLTDDCSDS